MADFLHSFHKGEIWTVFCELRDLVFISEYGANILFFRVFFS
jgi:hypothetical protein